MDDWHLAAMESLASSCRSVVLALAVMHVSTPLLYIATSSQVACQHKSRAWRKLLMVDLRHFTALHCAAIEMLYGDCGHWDSDELDVCRVS